MFGNPFSGFKLDTQGLTPAKEHKVHIAIETDYLWGRGWTQSQAKRFENIVYTQLEECGPYKIRLSEDKDFCPHIVSTQKGNRLDFHFHPTELTGYATPEDTQRIIEILLSCPEVIYGVKLTTDEAVYDLKDRPYQKLILSRTKEIVEILKDAKAHGDNLFDIGFDFAKACRIERFGDKSAYSSADIDVSTIENIAEIAKALGYFEEKNIDREEDDEKEM